MPNYTQPDFRNPVLDSRVGVIAVAGNAFVNGPVSPANHTQVNTANPDANRHGANFSVGRNEMLIAYPLTRYVQPTSSKEFPSGKI